MMNHPFVQQPIQIKLIILSTFKPKIKFDSDQYKNSFMRKSHGLLMTGISKKELLVFLR